VRQLEGRGSTQRLEQADGVSCIEVVTQRSLGCANASTVGREQQDCRGVTLHGVLDNITVVPTNRALTSRILALWRLGTVDGRKLWAPMTAWGDVGDPGGSRCGSSPLAGPSGSWTISWDPIMRHLRRQISDC
jgi:hypothetical protein